MTASLFGPSRTLALSYLPPEDPCLNFDKGFIMYMESAHPDAQELSSKIQSGGRNGVRKSHSLFEARNFICAHVKRNDQVSRRLIQYLSMQTHDLLILVRDAGSGRLLINPPEDQRWLFRRKSGLGRAAKNEWTVLKKIGPEFFDDMEKNRDWRFSFKEYYDIYVWDLEPGLPFPVLYNTVQEVNIVLLTTRRVFLSLGSTTILFPAHLLFHLADISILIIFCLIPESWRSLSIKSSY